MGETLAETRVEIGAQRAEIETTAERLEARVRRAVDLKAKLRENPALFVGLGVGAVFLLTGGPIRVARLVRRRVMRTREEKAYDALPKPMQDWIDTFVDRIGPKAEEARQALAVELLRWRHDPRKHGKVSKKLAEQLAEGPPGPGRTSWKAAEAAAAILSAALARKAAERFLSGEPPSGHATLDQVGTLGGAAEPEPGKAKSDLTQPKEVREAAAARDAAEEGDGYSSMSARSREGAS